MTPTKDLPNLWICINTY